MIAAVLLLAGAIAATPAPAPSPTPTAPPAGHAPPAAPLAIWPDDVGPPATEVGGVEFYLAEPEDDYFILAMQPIAPPLAKPEGPRLERLADIAKRLGADAVLLMEELPVDAIPEDPNAPMIGSGAFAAAAFLTFECACEEQTPRVFRTRLGRADGSVLYGVRTRHAGAVQRAKS